MRSHLPDILVERSKLVIDDPERVPRRILPAGLADHRPQLVLGVRRHRAACVWHDQDPLHAEHMYAEHERVQRGLRHATTGVAEDLRVARLEAEHAQRDDARVHAGDDRDTGVGDAVETAQFEGIGKPHVRCQQVVELTSHARHVREPGPPAVVFFGRIVRTGGSEDSRSIRFVATPLPPIDVDQVAQFWQRFLTTGIVDASTPLPELVESFGDSVEITDELVDLVVHGPKRATASALAEYELDGSSRPQPGTISVATDGSGRARAVLRTTDVRIGPLSSVDESFAWDEGEDDRTRESWLEVHEQFFRRYLPTIGVDFDPDMATVFERFEVLFAE